MNVEPNARNKAILLQKKPLTAALLQPGWNSASWLADTLYIYPGGTKKQDNRSQPQEMKTYERDRDELVAIRKKAEKQAKEAKDQQKLAYVFKDSDDEKATHTKDEVQRKMDQGLQKVAEIK